MADQFFIEKYSGANVTRNTNNLAQFYADLAGTFTELRVRVPNFSVGGPHTFNFNINGVAQYVPASAFILNSGGAGYVQKTGLSIAVAKGDALSWDLVNKGSGSLVAPIFFEHTINDGVLVAAKGDVVKTTGSLANAATENGTVALGKTFLIQKVSANKACRIRLYPTAAFRTADAARAIGTDPIGEHGVLMDLYLTGSNLTWEMATPLPCYDGQAVRTGEVFYAIENKSGSTGTVAVTFTRNLLEI
jgi:hypothetical protein